MSAIRILQISTVIMILYVSTSGTEAQRGPHACPRPQSCPSDAQIKALQENCSNSLILEVTGYCRIVCPKLLGDTCGGRCAQEGICIDDGSASDEGVKCSVSIGDLAADDSNLTDVGRCVRRCRVNYTLADTGACVPQCQQDYVLESNGTCVNKVCLKNCSAEDGGSVCGSDGRWYMNACELRQQRFCRNRPIVQSDESTCNSACRELTTPDNGNFTLSNELVSGSVATFICNDGFMLDRPVKPVCKGSAVGWSPVPPSCIRPPCNTQACNDARGYKCVNMVDDTSGYVVAKCVCKARADCDTSNLSEATMVCGSDGVTYLSQCFFYATACPLPNPNSITIRYFRKCRAKRTSVPVTPAAMRLQSRARS